MRIFIISFITSYQLSVGKRKFILMSLLPVSQAAKLVGKHPTTLKAAIKRGTISASKNDNNEWILDMSDVTRIYPLKDDNQKNKGDKSHQVNSQQLSSVLKEELEVLRQENAVLKEKLSSKDRELELIICQLEQSEKRERQFYDLAMQNGRLLTHYTEQEKEKSKPKKKSWLFR